MTVKPSAPVCWGWISVWILVCSAADQINIPAKPGDNVTLPCRAPSSTNIIVVEWNRTDPRPEYVFVYRSMQHDPDNQHPYFKDRVELEDSEMKDGDVSLVFRNVMINDSGTYECFVVQEKTHRWNRSPQLISIVHLSVHQPGSTGGQTGERGAKDGGDKEGGDEDGGNMNGNSGGNVGLIVGLSLLVVMVVVVGSVLLKYKRRMKKNPHPPPPPDEEAGDQQLL